MFKINNNEIKVKHCITISLEPSGHILRNYQTDVKISHYFNQQEYETYLESHNYIAEHSESNITTIVGENKQVIINGLTYWVGEKLLSDLEQFIRNKKLENILDS